MEINDKDLSQDDAVNEKGPPERPQVVVDLSEDAEADVEERVQPTPEVRKTRRERERRQREEFQTRLSDYERQLNDLRAQLAQRPQQYQPQQYPQSPQVEANPYDSKIAALSSQYDALVLAIQAPGQSQEQVTRLVEQARKIDDQRKELVAEKVVEAKLAARGAQGGEAGGENSFIKAAMQAEFPQIFRNKALQARALAEASYLVDHQGRTWDLETARESGRRALAAFGFGGKPPAPTDADRARFSNTPSRAGANGGGTGQTYAPPPFELKLARAWVKGRQGSDAMSDEDAWRVWSKETGNRRQAG